MYAIAYRWKLKPGTEAQFERAWAAGTSAISAEFGGLGSRLHAGEDGFYYAYAQWPDKETYEKAMETRMHHSDDVAREAYRDAIAEDGSEILFAGEMVCDLLQSIPRAGD